MTTLYELSDECQQAFSNIQILYEQGDIDKDVMEDAMEVAGEDFKEKCINVGIHIKNLRSDLRQLEEVMSEYKLRADKVKGSLKFYENYLDVHMQKHALAVVESKYVNLSYKNLPDIVDCIAATDEFSIIPEKTIYPPDKKKIKAFLQNYGELPFAKMITDRTKLVIE